VEEPDRPAAHPRPHEAIKIRWWTARSDQDRRWIEAQGAATIAQPPAVTQEVETAVRATLEDAGRLSTPLGQVALALARRLDAPGGDTGAGLAALAKQLAATLAAVTADARPADDLLDELRARRDRKLGHPGGRS
jgi:hypothetical protein